MKKVLGLFLSLGLLVSVSAILFAGNSKGGEAPQIEPFNLETLDPTLTIFEAIKEYPEILDIYCIVPLSDDEAQQKISEGMRCFELDDTVSAVDLLSSLNARRVR